MVRKLKLTDVSVYSGLAILAYAEYTFGTTVLALPYLLKGEGVPTISLALAVPAFIDSYVLTAFSKGRDVHWAMGLVVTSATLGLTAHTFQLDDKTRLLATVVFSVLVAVVMWRVKNLANTLDAEDRVEATRVALLKEKAAAEAELARIRQQAAETQDPVPSTPESAPEPPAPVPPKLELVGGTEQDREVAARSWVAWYRSKENQKDNPKRQYPGKVKLAEYLRDVAGYPTSPATASKMLAQFKDDDEQEVAADG